MRVGKQFEWKQYKILPKYYIRNHLAVIYTIKKSAFYYFMNTCYKMTVRHIKGA